MGGMGDVGDVGVRCGSMMVMGEMMVMKRRNVRMVFVVS